MVGESKGGRNSEFAANLEQLLRTPWHFANEALPRDTFYLANTNLSDREIAMARWDDD